jgi:acetyl esterase/lipase
MTPPLLPLWNDDELGGVADRRVEHATSPELFFPPRLIRNVTRPTISVHLPPAGTANGLGVIVCPGGALHFHSIEPEGTDVADWLNQRGIAAFVLEYRLIPTVDDPKQFEDDMLRLFTGAGGELGELKGPYEADAIADGLRAIELVREHAAEWGVDAAKVGILGFSAGGFVACRAALEGTGTSRPDFVVAVYAALWEPFEAPAPPMPLFVAVANDDQIGATMTGTARRLHEAWSAVGGPVELHMYQAGGHGFGMKRSGAPSDGWIEHAHMWLTFNVQAGLIGSSAR